MTLSQRAGIVHQHRPVGYWQVGPEGFFRRFNFNRGFHPRGSRRPFEASQPPINFRKGAALRSIERFDEAPAARKWVWV